MKANEFVKKFGIDSFKVAMICPQLKRYSYAILYSDEVDFSNNFIGKHSDYMFKTSEIKRIVESHELIEKDFKSVEMAEYEYMVSGDYSDIYWVRVKQAIADVESCQ